MKKIIFFFVITIFSFNVYADTTLICDAYDQGMHHFKATIEHDSELDHYKISLRDKIYFFDERGRDGYYYAGNRRTYYPSDGSLHFMSNPDYSFENCKKKK